MRAAIAIAVTALGVGCASSPPVPPPQRAVDGYVVAARGGQADSLYALLSSERRATLSREQFAARLADTHAEVREAAERIADTGAKAEASATVDLQDGEQVRLVLEEGQWRIAAGPLDAYALRTPVDAVETLRRVLLRRDLAGLLQLLTRSERTSWEAVLGHVVDSTADPLEWETEIQGDDAIVRIRGGGVIVLQREAGRWRIHDIRDTATP